MDTAGVIASFLTGTYTVTRTADDTMTHGRATAGSSSTLTIKASVQPAKGDDLLLLAEGRRATETRVVYTTTELGVGIGPNKADRLSIDGVDWQVQHVESWRPDPLTPAPYFRCLVQRVVTS